MFNVLEDDQVIVGPHSIIEALNNSNRSSLRLLASEDGLSELKKHSSFDKESLGRVEVKIISSHKLQEIAKKIYKDKGYNYTRVPGQALLITSSIEIKDLAWLYDKTISQDKIKILCLDQVTDGHNAAAIMRTAAFYGIDCILTASKGVFGISPSFSRIASGALEHVSLVRCSSLPKALKKLSDMGVECVGFSEHSSVSSSDIFEERGICLVLGAEDVGLSNAVMRVLNKTISLQAIGNIKSLNVSVAAAVAMEKIFSKK